MSYCSLLNACPWASGPWLRYGREAASSDPPWSLHPTSPQVLETCMKSCGKRFHDEVGKFRFLNELIKVVSPKVGARRPELRPALSDRGDGLPLSLGPPIGVPASAASAPIRTVTCHKHRPFLRVPFTQLSPGQLVCRKRASAEQWRPTLKLLRTWVHTAAPARAVLALRSLPADLATAPHLGPWVSRGGSPCPHLTEVVPLRPWIPRPQT